MGDDPHAVRLSQGAILPDTVAEGSTIGRAPGAEAPDDRTAWVLFDPRDASPGRPNPLPRVSILLPLDGSIFDAPSASLQWYAAPGASSYRVEVASDASFAAPVVDVTVNEPKVSTGDLPSGTYLWRVASIASDGTVAAFSDPSSFRVGGMTASLLLASIGATGSHRLRMDALAHQLPIPMIYQHKDTPMLLLERPVQLGRHAWDLDHGVYDANDPADNMNCVLASLQMMNFFSGGNLNQDRIGYEVFKNRAPGPERDLDYGDGLYDDQIRMAFEFAFVGASPRQSHPVTPEELWTAITASIDRGVPLMAVKQISANRSHAFVVTGYEDFLGSRVIGVNDPIAGPIPVLLDRSLGGGLGWDIWQLDVAARARIQEPTVHMDSDGDGVVDFDEIARFHTDPNLADTDADDVLDKEDIAASVFDPTYGYAAHPNRGGRDFDSDGRSMELDPDADDGGCEDGREDTDLNGARNRGETWNFQASDDTCNDPGTWSSVLGNGPTPGTYGGTDELICVALDDGPPFSEAFNPVGADPVLHVSAVSDSSGESILVGIAGGVEGLGDYLSDTASLLGPVTIQDGVMHMSIQGSETLSYEKKPRTMLLMVDCPLFR